MWVLLQQHARRRAGSSLISTLLHFGAAGLFFLAILDSSPLPTFGGLDILTVIFAAGHNQLWYEYAATSTAGSIVGAWLTYRVAREAGTVYLDRKFKGSKLSKFHQLFENWATVTLIASCMIPIPTPTSMFFAAAGVSNYPREKFLVIVSISRAVRFFALAFIAAHYGRHILRVLRHPTEHWGWMAGFIAVMIALIVGGIVANRRLNALPATK